MTTHPQQYRRFSDRRRTTSVAESALGVIMGAMASLPELIADGIAHPISGWDFSWVAGRMRSTAPPWSYDRIVAVAAARSPDLLDLGTGGGEWLAQLRSRPPRTVAVEGLAPNVSVARARLEPLGIEVLPYQGPSDNMTQTAHEPQLPFPDASFALIVNRHESFVAAEVHRVLKPGGLFITQQVGSYDSVRALLGAPAAGPAASWSVAEARRQLQAAGLTIEAARAVRIQTKVDDVGALVWYLRAVPWEIPDFTVERYLDRLQELHQRCATGPLSFSEERFIVQARKPQP